MSAGEHLHIAALRTEAEFREAFPIMRELRPDLDEATYLARLAEVDARADYHLFAGRVQGRIVALAGVEIVPTVHNGRQLLVQQMVTTAAERSKGYGRRILEYVEAFAREADCRLIELASAIERDAAHRFYRDRMGYEVGAYFFLKRLE